MSQHSSDSTTRLKNQDPDSAKRILLIDHTKSEEINDDDVRPALLKLTLTLPSLLPSLRSLCPQSGRGVHLGKS